MREATALPVTVKHRIGIDRTESYAFVRDFVGTVAERGGCEVFIVHARNAWLKGLSPKQNREVPPLRYEMVYRLKADFPHLTLVLNGGVTSDEQIAAHLQHVDGVMLGRHAYHEPFAMAAWDQRFLGAEQPALHSRDEAEERYVAYVARFGWAPGHPWLAATRHMMGLRNGQPGARRWRQVWSDTSLRALDPHVVMQRARQALAQAAPSEPVAA
jgi:tRNA-dihydrouridine synthase A